MRTIALAVTAALLTPIAAYAADQTEPASTYDWSGIYTGLQAGGAWSRAESSQEGLRLDSPSIGGFAGANWQAGDWVFGIEGDVSYSKQRASYMTVYTNVDIEAALRARIGYAFDRTMIYGAAGLAVARVHVEAIPILDKKEIFTGWTVGGGAEYAFTDNWTTRLDYRYSDYGNSHFGIGGDGFDLTSHALRFGVAYKF